jgi:hypothetical protein
VRESLHDRPWMQFTSFSNKGGQHFGRNIDFVLVLALNICVCNPLLFWCIERIHQSMFSKQNNFEFF